MISLHLQWSAPWNHFKEVYLLLKFGVHNPSITGHFAEFEQSKDDGYFDDFREVKDDGQFADLG